MSANAEIERLHDVVDKLNGALVDVEQQRDAALAELARLREVLPTVNEIGMVRAIVHEDGPIGRMLARFEVARILLDAME